MFLKKPPPGLEPGTFALQKRCSAVELGWRKVRIPLPTQNIYLPLIFRRELKHIISVKGIRFLFRIRASGKIANGGGAFRRNRSFRRTRVLQIQRRRHKRISGVPWVWRVMPSRRGGLFFIQNPSGWNKLSRPHRSTVPVPRLLGYRHLVGV